jgi:beta-mannosidase
MESFAAHVVDCLLTPYRSSDSKQSWLVFNGLDTFTTIEFCGKHVATTDNQFRQYTFDISDALKDCKGSPSVSLNFGSCPKIANAIAADPNSQRE